MKKILSSVALILSATAFVNAQTTATNWTAPDCSSTSHTLFNELDNGKVIVFVWVMPCGSCINPAKTAYTAVQSFATSNPGKVLYYLADDLGDASCATLSSWVTSNNIGSTSNMTIFSNAGNLISESNFGGTGMPHIVVMGGPNHQIFFNKLNSAANDAAGITTAINSAIAVTGINDLNNIKFSVVPNPTTESFKINYSKELSKLSVISVTGQVIKEHSFSQGVMNPTIILNGIPAGVYSVKVTDVAGQTGIQKIIKD
jgi:hypothetical protein